MSLNHLDSVCRRMDYWRIVCMVFSARFSILILIDSKVDRYTKGRCLSWLPYVWMRDISDSREWYVSDNLEIRRTCFHLVVTYSGGVFYFLNALTLPQHSMNRWLLPIISSKWWLQPSTPIYPTRYPLYEFWSSGAPSDMCPPSMNWVPHFILISKLLSWYLGFICMTCRFLPG